MRTYEEHFQAPGGPVRAKIVISLGRIKRCKMFWKAVMEPINCISHSLAKTEKYRFKYLGIVRYTEYVHSRVALSGPSYHLSLQIWRNRPAISKLGNSIKLSTGDKWRIDLLTFPTGWR
jgi:hypothetical protein